MKEYILLKDLPYAKAGAVYRSGELCQYVTLDTDQDLCTHDTLISGVVENSPEWFKEVVPFVWTDDIVREYAGKCICDFAHMKFLGEQSNYKSITIEDFKKSKQ